MGEGLAVGEHVWLGRWQRWATVGSLLGRGGEGWVHEVAVEPGHALALKWYHRPDLDTPASLSAHTELIETGPPDERFLWPLDLARSQQRPGFGYVMPLRRHGLVGMHDLLLGDVHPGWRVLATAGMELADAFLQLHSRGLCYRDINLGNVFFDPLTGGIAVCDCDNVGVSGASPPKVRGTRGFMAPEVARGEVLPDTSTDRHSLAVLLFRLLVRDDPFLGRREERHPVLDAEAAQQLWADEPVFIFDPDDMSNRPVPGVHVNPITIWPMLPTFLRALFERTFTEGLRDPLNGRVTESEWRQSLARLRDLVRTCLVCRAEHIVDPARLDATTSCWACGQPVTPPLLLAIDSTRDVVVLEPGVALFEHHLGTPRYQFSQPHARVTSHPEDPRRWGLTNTGTGAWRYRSSGEWRTVPPGRSANLVPGARLHFGTCTAEVRGG